ncbi:MAG: hypothetical protein IJU76_04840 [Desulfovibrionaceae bacterium]|nr:hypothetical protein [Desulfovibrionaceae bacterium]
MNERVDDLTIEFEEEGQILVKEVDKCILSRGAWATVLFRYNEWRPSTSDYGPDKVAIRRYQKVGGEYKQKTKFVISSVDQAKKIVNALVQWFPEILEKEDK